MNNGGLPDISVTLEDGRDLATALANGELGNADYGLHYIGLSGTDVTDEVTGFTLGGAWTIESGPFKSLEFGAASTERSKVRNTIENDTNGGSCQYCNLYGITFASLGADVVHTLSLPNFMRNAGGHYPRSFVSFDVPRLLDALRALDGQPILDEDGNPTGEVYDASRTLPEFNPVQSYDVDEETIALYLKATSRPTNGSRAPACAGSRPIRPRGRRSTASSTSTTRRRRFRRRAPTSPTAPPILSRRKAAMTSGCRR
jgi:hypothetical protein